MNTSLAATEPSDDLLWQRSRNGDREAYGRIVERYQSLICSLAFSACGNLAAAEDLAQDTFVAAWQGLDGLREPSKLRGWLCGIVRNLTATALRRDQRRGAPNVPLEAAPEPATVECSPAAQAISREQEALLWNSLAALPETYRESMVLFYREGRSIIEVARALEVSEDAIKQRLSRGRALLRDELATFVEDALSQTRPTKAFTVAVLAALPVLAPATASAATFANAAAKGVGVAKAISGVGAWPIVGPIIGLAVGLVSSRMAAMSGRSVEERALLVRHARRMVFFAWIMSLGLALAMWGASKLAIASPLAIILAALAWTATLVGTILWTSRRVGRQVERIRRDTRTDDDSHANALAKRELKLDQPWLYRSKWRFLGLPLIDVAWGADMGMGRTRKAVGWIAIGDVAFSPGIAFGGVAVGPLAIGGVTIGVLSLSLWGIALGVLAVGSLAFGYWGVGLGAIGWESAAGGAVIAHDYAAGALASAAEANTPAAKEWIFSQWFVRPVTWFFVGAHVLIPVIIVAALARVWRRSRALRRADLHS